MKAGSKRLRTKAQFDADTQDAEEQKAELDEKLRKVAEYEAMKAQRDQLQAEKANLQRMVQANAEGADVLKRLVDAELVGKADDGTYAIANGPSLGAVAHQSKAKAQLLGVQKGEKK